MSEPRGVKHLGRPALRMSEEEIDAFLRAERTCRVATVGPDGRPHVTPLWFIWDGSAVWLCSLVRSRRWTDLTATPWLGLVVDTGTVYGELRGVEICGLAAVVGEVPWSGELTPDIEVPDGLFSEKYPEQSQVRRQGRHAWLRIDPDTIATWDFRKVNAAG